MMLDNKKKKFLVNKIIYRGKCNIENTFGKYPSASLMARQT